MSTQIKDMMKVNDKSIVLSVNGVEANDSGNVILPAVADTQVMTKYLDVDNNTKGYLISTINEGNGEIDTGNIDTACYLTYFNSEPTIVCNAFKGRLRGTAIYAEADKSGNKFLEKYVRNNEDSTITGKLTVTKAVSANSFITASGIEIL